MREIKHLSVHQWLRSAIPDSQQPTSPIGFLFLKLPPPPCAVLLVMCTIKQNTALPAAIPAPRACGHSRQILKDLVCERWGQHAAEPILSAAHSALDFKTFGGSKTNLAIETVTTEKKLMQVAPITGALKLIWLVPRSVQYAHGLTA